MRLAFLRSTPHIDSDLKIKSAIQDDGGFTLVVGGGGFAQLPAMVEFISEPLSLCRAQNYDNCLKQSTWNLQIYQEKVKILNPT